jgi:hypothetical protein
VSEDFSKICYCLHDHFGLFVQMAKRLAESGARVLYQTPVDRYDRINEGVIGDGIEGVELVEEFWPYKNDITCFVFPDIRHSGLQAELRSQGFPVWGSAAGMDLELKRGFFLKKLEELGLPVAPHKIITGISNLAAYLKDKKDIWIKVSKWRGTWETYHWREQAMDETQIHIWSLKWGGLKEKVIFYCFEKIKTTIEIGADTYCIDGKWPKTMLHGLERKDAAYFSAVTPIDKMPDEIMEVITAFSPYMKEVGYRCQWSMEIRVTEEEAFFIDPTCRGGLPSTRTLLEARNLPEIILAGAQGELIEPDYGFKFSAECMVNSKDNSDFASPVALTDEVKEAFMLQQCYEDEAGTIWYPPLDENNGSLGWLCATGNTPKETLQTMNHLADELPDGLNAAVEDLAEIIREIETMDETGIEFTQQPVPSAEIVFEPANQE